MGSAWFPPDHSQDRFERELRDEALTSGLLVVSRLLYVAAVPSPLCARHGATHA